MSAIIVISWILLAILLPLILWILVINFHERKDPTNPIIIYNHMQQYTGGHTLGIAKEVEFGLKRIRVVFAPRDNDYIGIANKDKEYKEYELFVDKSQWKPRFASIHRQEVDLYPPRHEELLEVYSSPEGRKIKETIKKIELEKLEEEVNRSKLTETAKLKMDDEGLKHMGRLMKFSNEFLEDSMRKISEKEEKK